MLEVCSPDTYAGISTEDDPYHLAIRSMVFGYGRAVQAGKRQYDTYTGYGGQIHQVDRGQANQIGRASCRERV